jgi:hypothetical protein
MLCGTAGHGRRRRYLVPLKNAFLRVAPVQGLAGAGVSRGNRRRPQRYSFRNRVVSRPAEVARTGVGPHHDIAIRAKDYCVCQRVHCRAARGRATHSFYRKLPIMLLRAHRFPGDWDQDSLRFQPLRREIPSSSAGN